MKENSELVQRTKGKRRMKNLFFVLVAFFIFLGVSEVVFRMTHLFNARISCSEPDPVLGWRFTPGRSYWFYKENDHPITGRINRFGWRDREWSLRPPDGVYRIAVLGDSYVESFQVETDRNFLTLTEKEFNKDQNIRLELMNFGRSGFTQTEELLVLKKQITQFSPNRVILFFLPENDLTEISRETTFELLRPFYHLSPNGELMLDTSFVDTREFRIKQWINFFTHHSALITLLGERYNLLQAQGLIRKKEKEHDQKRGQAEKIERYLSLCTDKADRTYLENYQLSKRLIRAMADYCNERNIRLMLVTIDTPAYLPEMEAKNKDMDASFNANFFEDDLKKFAASINIDYLGLQRIFRESYEKKKVHLHWGHWNYQGHQVVGKALADKLRSIIEREAVR